MEPHSPPWGSRPEAFLEDQAFFGEVVETRRPRLSLTRCSVVFVGLEAEEESWNPRWPRARFGVAEADAAAGFRQDGHDVVDEAAEAVLGEARVRKRENKNARDPGALETAGSAAKHDRVGMAGGLEKAGAGPTGGNDGGCGAGRQEGTNSIYRNAPPKFINPN